MVDDAQDQQRQAMNEIKHILVSPEKGSGLGVASLLGLAKQELDAMYASASQQIQRGQIKEAAKLFTMLVGLDHNQGKYWRGLGLCMQRMNMWPVAEFLYGVALERDPDDFVSRVFYAEVLLKLGRNGRARNEVERAIADGRRLGKADTLPFVKRGERLRAFILRAGEAQTVMEG